MMSAGFSILQGVRGRCGFAACRAAAIALLLLAICATALAGPEAESELREWLKLKGSEDVAVLLLERIVRGYIKDKKYDHAAAITRDAAEAIRTPWHTLVIDSLLAEILVLQGRNEEALKVYEQSAGQVQAMLAGQPPRKEIDAVLLKAYQRAIRDLKAGRKPVSPLKRTFRYTLATESNDEIRVAFVHGQGQEVEQAMILPPPLPEGSAEFTRTFTVLSKDGAKITVVSKWDAQKPSDVPVVEIRPPDGDRPLQEGQTHSETHLLPTREGDELKVTFAWNGPALSFVMLKETETPAPEAPAPQK